jgi:3-deoxy-D-manno-octulosonic-acid transferase
MHNQHDLAAAALAEGAAIQVQDAQELAAEVVRLCSDDAQRKALRAASERLLLKNTGAALECANLLAALAGGERAVRGEVDSGQSR